MPQQYICEKAVKEDESDRLESYDPLINKCVTRRMHENDLEKKCIVRYVPPPP